MQPLNLLDRSLLIEAEVVDLYTAESLRDDYSFWKAQKAHTFGIQIVISSNHCFKKRNNNAKRNQNASLKYFLRETYFYHGQINSFF